MNIIGLGHGGCHIAEEFNKYPQYTCYKLDVSEEGPRCWPFPLFKTAEEYEENVPNLKKFFKPIRGEVLFILAGSGAISGATLGILEQLKTHPISVLYVQPELDLLTTKQKMRERMVRGVLQEYARCGLLRRIYLVSNPAIEAIIGDVPIMGYLDKLNETLVSSLHMIHVFQNTKPVVGKMEDPQDVCRISTFGLFDAEKNTEKMFFPLDKPRDICYIYGVNKNKLQTDGNLFRKIVNQMKSKISPQVNISYAVLPTSYEEDMGFCISHASLVQS